jgi:class 3 adenylate cyclase
MFLRLTRKPDLPKAFSLLTQQGIDSKLATALATYYQSADPRDLLFTNPRLIAERLGVDERTSLRVLLQALKAGLVTLHWEVRCPHCGMVTTDIPELGSFKHTVTCVACTSEFPPQLDHDVRVSFSLAERLRSRAVQDDPTYREAVDRRLGVASGHALLLLPEFQRLFPQQRILPNESLDVARVALLFTDLAGSTAIYARRGDPRAYYLVRLHFDELFRVADQCGGLMIKTIGDAVMAAFQTPAEALKAAIEMQEAIAALNARANLEGDERLILKVGLHSGPCLSVTLNDQPDYFGGTVNTAARVQGLSRGHDIVFTEAILEDPEAHELLGARPLEREEVLLKGIDQPVRVVRIAA